MEVEIRAHFFSALQSHMVEINSSGTVRDNDLKSKLELHWIAIVRNFVLIL